MSNSVPGYEEGSSKVYLLKYYNERFVHIFVAAGKTFLQEFCHLFALPLLVLCQFVNFIRNVSLVLLGSYEKDGDSILKLFELYETESDCSWFDRRDDFTEFTTNFKVSRSWINQQHQLTLSVVRLSNRFLTGSLSVFKFVFIPLMLAMAYFVVHPLQILLSPFIFTYQDAKRASIPFEKELFTVNLEGRYNLAGPYYNWKRERIQNQLSNSNDWLQRSIKYRLDFIDSYHKVPKSLQDSMVNQLLSHDSLWMFIFRDLPWEGRSLEEQDFMQYQISRESYINHSYTSPGSCWGWKRSISANNYYFSMSIMLTSSQLNQEQLINHLLQDHNKWKNLVKTVMILYVLWISPQKILRQSLSIMY